jgi:MoaA/NifB/PqqE/SkfB family radical SAM enzyme
MKMDVNSKPDGLQRRSKSTVQARKMRQVMASVRHYLFELSQCRSISDLHDWIYYKLPHLFPLRTLPTVLNIELTNSCNFACPHCPRDALNEGRGLGFMPVPLFRRIIEETAGKVSMVKLIGLGEPSLHPDLDRIMRLLRDNRIKTLLYTNGTLFERYTPEEIMAWDADELVVSIDGVDERSFARLRVGGDLPRLQEGMAKFREHRANAAGHGPRIEVRHVIMPNETPAMLSAFRNYWRKGLADTVKYCFLGAPYNRRREKARQRPRCRDIRREMHIRYDGRVPLCGYEGHREWIGDLTGAAVEQVWRAPRLDEVRDLHRKRDLSKLDFCKTCQFW